jgi:ABC-2 type transport system ATP-binding protein
MLILSQIFRISEEINFIICHKICYLRYRNKMMKTQNLVFEEIRELILFKDLDRAVKRIIDITLDTENLRFYNETNSFLDWLIQNLLKKLL